MRKLLPLALVLCSGPLFGLPPADTTIFVQKDTALHYPTFRLEWQVLINGATTQKGVIPFLTLSSKHPTPVPIPTKFPTGNDEVFLRLVYRRPGGASATAGPASPPLLTRTIPIRTWKGDYAIPPTGEIAFADSGGLFTITSPNAIFRFDKESGWLLHYETNHLVLIADSAALRPSIWPPSLTQPHLQLFSTTTGSQLVIVRTEYTLPEVSCLLHVSYTINAAGEMLVSQSLEADTTHPDPTSRPVLPSFGMTWQFPPALDSVTCYAPPADTVTTPAIFHAPFASIPATPIRWIAFTSADKKSIRIIADSSFLLLRSTGTQLHILRPMANPPLLFSDYQYAFKISSILPLPSPANNRSIPPHAANRSISSH